MYNVVSLNYILIPMDYYITNNLITTNKTNKESNKTNKHIVNNSKKYQTHTIHWGYSDSYDQ